MKTKSHLAFIPVLRAIYYSVSIILTCPVFAATNDLTGALQRGLFEEEANRNLDAAAQAYQAVSTQFDKDRKLAATAIFRLGEIYRKQNKTNEAVAQYERITREFSDQETLATLSKQNLAGLGRQRQFDATPAATPSDARSSDAAALYRSLVNRSPAELRQMLPTLVPDELLTKLLAQYQTTQEASAKAMFDFGSPHPEVGRLRAVLKSLDEQIEQRIQGILAALKVRADLASTENTSIKTSANTPVTIVEDAEEIEIRRIQAMIQNSPDLINAPRDGGYTPLGRAAGAGWLRVARFLLDHGAAVQQGSVNSTPLHEAVKAGHRAMVELLLERGATIDARDGTGSTPLHLAAGSGFLSVAEVLVQHKANLEAEDIQEGNRTPLERAAAAGKTALVTFLAEKGAQFKGAPALAMERGHMDLLRKLLELGANPDGSSDSDSTALMRAVYTGNLEATKLLLGAKANPNLGKTATPLVTAVAGNHLRIVELLLQAGADPNLPGALSPMIPSSRQAFIATPGSQNLNQRYSYSPLQVAVGKDYPLVAKLLLANKADPNTKSHEKSGWGAPAPLTRWTLKNPEMLKALLDAGADPNTEGYVGQRLLSSAAQDGSPEAIGFLLAAGAKPDVLDGEGESPLSRVASSGCLPCVDALLKAKANPNLATQRSRTALFAAIAGNWTNIVTALLDAGADPNQSDQNGSPVHSAVNVRSKEILTLLLVHKADPNVRGPDGSTPLDLTKPRAVTSFPAGRNLATLEELAASLREYGAVDDLPDFRSIGVSRTSSGYRSTMFTLGTNQWNRFMLSELIAHQLGLLSTKPAGDWQRSHVFRKERWYQNSVRFPDFSRITIYRPLSDGKRRTPIPVSFSPNGEVGDKRTDVDLQPGDVVEIPEADHPVSESWLGPTASELQAWTNTLARSITIVIAGQSTKLKLTSYAEIFPGSSPDQIITPASFMVRSVLDQSKLVRFSSDLTRVKVTRPRGAEGKPQSWVLDCSGKSPFPDLWLMDGDEIEVPDKP